MTKNAWFYLTNSILNCARKNNMALMESFLRLMDHLLQTPSQIESFIRSMADFSHISLDLTGYEKESEVVLKESPSR